MITPTFKVKQQHSRQGTNTSRPAMVFNDRGSYYYYTDRTIICPELNYCGVFPAGSFTPNATADPSNFQSTGVSDNWTTNYNYCVYFSPGLVPFYSFPLSAAWSTSNTGEGLNLNFKIKLNQFPVAGSSYNIFEFGNAAANRGFNLRITYISGTTATFSIYTGSGTSFMWTNAMSLSTWYTIGFWVTQGASPLYSMTGDASSLGTITTRVNNAAKSWQNANLTTDSISIGGAKSGSGNNTFNGWLTDVVFTRQRNGLEPTIATGNWALTTFI